MSYKAEETLKTTVTNDLGKSCSVCLRAGLPFRALNRGDRDGSPLGCPVRAAHHKDGDEVLMVMGTT